MFQLTVDGPRGIVGPYFVKSIAFLETDPASGKAEPPDIVELTLTPSSSSMIISDT